MKKKLISLLLASAMVVSLAACGGKGDEPATNDQANDGTTPAASDDNAQPADSDEGGGAPADENVSYTYNTATTAFPTNWSPALQQTNEDSTLMQYLVTPLYTFDYNDTMDGYQLVPLAATGEPTDVTADYVGQWGIEEGDTSLVWSFPLREDVKWEDGTPITANDYVRSAQLLLDPVAKNHRADMFYASSLKVANAKNYLYSGQHAYLNPMISANFADEEYVPIDSFEVNEDGVLTVDGKDIALDLNTGSSWGASLGDYYEEGAYVNADGVDVYAEILVPNADADGFVPATQEVYDAVCLCIAQLHGYDDADAYAADAGDYAYLEAQEMMNYGETYEEIDFSEVGIQAPSDYELVVALEVPLEGFYLRYAFTDGWLIKEDLYLSCEKVENGVYTNTYGTSADTTASYGPYKLVSFQQDKEYILEKNENYFDLEGKWQTTRIVMNYVVEAATRLQMFLNGELDVYGLSAEDMENYATSDYTYYATEASTFFVAMNPDLDALAAKQAALGDNFNKTILTVEEFRQALSYSLDRASFALATAPTNSPAFGVYSGLIIYDPEVGATYRSTDEAKQVLVNFWGLADDIGDGKLYADVDDAIDSITGYNLEMAREKFAEAYDIAKEQGLIDDDDVVRIMIGIPSSSNFYAKGNEFLVNCWTEAVVGTPFEGRLTFDLNDTLGNGFGTALRNNEVDLLFGVGFVGSALDPYNLIQCYTTDDNLRYNTCWDTANDMLTVNLSGKDWTASVADWTYTINGEKITITDADGNTEEFSAGVTDGNSQERFEILAALEGAVLERYELLPLIDDSSAQLKSMKINYATEEYIFGMAFGGVEYYTYNYTDDEWAAFVAEQGGTLTYN
ncbi:MAG: ABC transporter substrate-binding protein [bacterium]|nr:ABC transporter substrate-binding protein [bacterium]